MHKVDKQMENQKTLKKWIFKIFLPFNTFLVLFTTYK